MEEEQNINEEDHIELRSEEVQEILGTPPHWMIRWGTTLAAFAFLLVIVLAWFIKYPEVKQAGLVLTTSIPPSPIVARVDANIEKLFVEEKDVVTEGQILAVLQSTAEFGDVLFLDDELNKLRTLDEEGLKIYRPDRDLSLGNLQSGYSDLLENFETYNRGEKTDFVQESVFRLQQERRTIENGISNEKLRLVDIELELANAKIDQQRVKELYVGKIKSKLDLEKAQSKVVSVRDRIKQVKSNIYAKEQELITIGQQIAKLQNDQTVSSDINFVKLREEVRRLQSEIDNWKQKYLLLSPASGQVAFDGLIKENQFVENNTTLLRIIPPEERKVWIGRVELSTENSGKVEVGQRVVVKFDNYSYEEYGIVDGIVSKKSVLPSGNTYYLEVDFPRGLRT
ncbi:MAG: HlyD family secretion protein, partial [Saprospiraceae bacterium]